MRQNVFPCTEISLVDRRDLGDRDNVFPHMNTTFPLSGITFCRVSNCSIQLMFSATSQPETLPGKRVDILYTLDSASKYSVIQKLKP